MRIQPHSKLLFIGDSITDSNRAKPVAEGNETGNGYVSLVNAWLAANFPAHAIRVINMGINGNTVRELKARWRKDVLELKPDWLSIFIGINDVWRQFDTPLRTEQHVLIDEYERELDALIESAKPGLQGLVLMTPYFLEPNRSDPMRATMDAYGDVVRKLAGKHAAILVDTQAALDALMQHTHPMGLCWDRIHPSLTGHMVLAQAFLRAVDAGA
ncbi:MAG TPA: SGNH/GDSL hydrolase family protein [Pseudomonadales bacterium]|nr:SGNH/GDSL hydrolase family protein [Pseudomonadales bacterium]